MSTNRLLVLRLVAEQLHAHYSWGAGVVVLDQLHLDYIAVVEKVQPARAGATICRLRCHGLPIIAGRELVAVDGGDDGRGWRGGLKRAKPADQNPFQCADDMRAAAVISESHRESHVTGDLVRVRHGLDAGTVHDVESHFGRRRGNGVADRRGTVVIEYHFFQIAFVNRAGGRDSCPIGAHDRGCSSDQRDDDDGGTKTSKHDALLANIWIGCVRGGLLCKRRTTHAKAVAAAKPITAVHRIMPPLARDSRHQWHQSASTRSRPCSTRRRRPEACRCCEISAIAFARCCTPKAGRQSSSCRWPSASARTRRCSAPSTACS